MLLRRIFGKRLGLDPFRPSGFTLLGPGALEQPFERRPGSDQSSAGLLHAGLAVFIFEHGNHLALLHRVTVGDMDLQDAPEGARRQFDLLRVESLDAAPGGDVGIDDAPTDLELLGKGGAWISARGDQPEDHRHNDDDSHPGHQNEFSPGGCHECSEFRRPSSI